MAGAQNIRAGSAYVELLLKDAALRKGLVGARGLIKNFVEGFSIAAGLMSWDKLRESVTEVVTSFAEGGSHIAKLSAQTGIGTAAMSELGYAAKRSGSDVDTLAERLGHMEKTIGGALTGVGESAKAINVLGIGLDQLKGKSPDQQFEIIAEAISKIKDPAVRAKRAFDIFGKGALDLMPLLEKGAAGIEAYRKKAKELGFSMSPEQAKMAQQLHEAAEEFEMAKTGMFSAIGSALAGTMKDSLEYLTRLMASAKDWISKNAEVIQSIAKFAAKAVALATAIGVASGAYMLAGKAAGVMSSLFSVAVGVVAAGISPFIIAGRAINSLVVAGVSGFARLAASAIGLGASIARGVGSAAGVLGLAAGRILGGTAQIGAGLMQVGLSAGASLARGIASGAAAAVPSILAALRGVMSGAGAGLSAIGSVARSALAPVGRDIAYVLKPAFAAVGRDVLYALAPVWKRIGPGFRAAFLSGAIAADIIVQKFGPIAGRIASIASNIGQRVVGAWRSVGPAIARGLVSAIGSAFSRIRGIGAATAGALRAGAGNITRGVGGILNGLAGLAGSLGGAAGGALGSMFSGIAMAVPQVLMLAGGFASLLTPVGLVMAAIAGGVYVWTQFSDSGQKAFAAVMASIQPMLDTFMTAFGGIKDALAAGDLALAGKIGMLGLKIVMLQISSSISEAVGGVFGDMIGKLSSQLAGGDLAGAWGTAASGLAAIWDQFSLGVTTVFQTAMEQILKSWRQTTSEIAGWILKNSKQGGLLGKFLVGLDSESLNASTGAGIGAAGGAYFGGIGAVPGAMVGGAAGFLGGALFGPELGKGVNVEGEANRDAALAQQRQQLLQQRLDHARAQLAEAEYNGATLDDTGEPITSEDLKRVISDLETAIGNVPADFLAMGRQAIDQSIGASSDRINAAIEATRKQAQENADKSKADLAPNVAGGASGAENDLRELRHELYEARKAAADAAAEQKRKSEERSEQVAAAADAGNPDSLGRQVMGSFSAAALAAGGATSSPLDRIADAAEKQNEQFDATIGLLGESHTIQSKTLDAIRDGGTVDE